MAKQDQNSVIEPTDEELVIYKQLIEGITDAQMDDLSDEFFEFISDGKTKISFAKFLIDKFVRPIKEGDTIQIQQDDNKVVNLFCLIRKNVEGRDYLLFAEADGENEGALKTDFTYLFFVDGVDNVGTEVIDVMPHSPDTERILDILEADIDVIVDEEKDPGTPQPGQS